MATALAQDPRSQLPDTSSPEVLGCLHVPDSLPKAWGMQDEERTKQGLNEVPAPSEMNAMLARSPEELELFERMDAEMPWINPSPGMQQQCSLELSTAC